MTPVKKTDRIFPKLLFASGLVWIVFGAGLFIAVVGHISSGGAASSHQASWLFTGFAGAAADLTIGWVHALGFLIAAALSAAIGLTICAHTLPGDK